MNPRKLKRAVIKEELVELTGSHVLALILQQFIYWSELVKDFDRFILEEKQRAELNGIETGIEPTSGWIYKTAEELSEETMLGLASTTMRYHLKKLVNMGFISERNNPKYRWDRTKQYRVNIVKIQHELWKLGFPLDKYSQPLLSELRTSESELREQKSEVQKQENRGAIPEITTEITNKDISEAQLKDEFEQWWRDYPRKKGKGGARKKWIKLRKDGVTVEKLTLARDNYRVYVKQNCKKEDYILYGSTFLGDERGWEDYIDDGNDEQPNQQQFALAGDDW